MASQAVNASSTNLQSLYQKHIRPHARRMTFISLHYFYFCSTCLVAAVIFWGSSTPSRSVSFVDSLFLTVSAMTEAGLNTVNLSTLNTWQQIILFLLIVMGSAIVISSAVLHTRKRAFEMKLEELAERRWEKVLQPRVLRFSLSRRRASGSGCFDDAIASGAVRGRAITDQDPSAEYQASFPGPRHTLSNESDTEINAKSSNDKANSPLAGHIRFESDVQPAPVYAPSPHRTLNRTYSRIFSGGGVGIRGMENHPCHSQPVRHSSSDNELALEDGEPRPKSRSNIDKYLRTVNGNISRNSQFHHLSEKERRKLGGIEYDAICLLSWTVPIYFVSWQLLGAISVGAWLQNNRPDIALENGLNPFWTGAFFSVSAFNNSGMALLDANAAALQTSYYALLTLSLLILAGNTCFPIFLRLILWVMKKCLSLTTNQKCQKWRSIFVFILDHPRRVYTNLFPSTHTWWLVFSLVLLNGIDWIAFEVLNIGNPTTESIPPHFRVLDGLFQAFAVRCGGFYVVNVSQLNPGLLVLYLLMMYISALPVAITMRNTNVYEERSLGIYADDLPSKSERSMIEKSSNSSNVLSRLKQTMTMTHGSNWSRQDFVRQQLRGQLAHDLWWLALAILLITIIETSQIHRDPVVFSIFNIMFEVVSAYGTVGISTGVPWNAYSFSGAWHTGSKLVLCAVMLRGRHRGLPVAVDRAILLPHATLAWAEEEDAHKRSGSMPLRRGRSRRRESADGNATRERSGPAMV